MTIEMLDMAGNNNPTGYFCNETSPRGNLNFTVTSGRDAVRDIKLNGKNAD